MASKLKVSALTVSPSLIRASVAPNDNVYVAGGVQLDLSPGKILDPNLLGVTGPSQVPPVTPGIFQEWLAGYYAQVVPTTGGLSGYKLQYFAPGGAEINAGAYPAQITAGDVVIEIAYTS
jgi:hypothetical protein